MLRDMAVPRALRGLESRQHRCRLNIRRVVLAMHLEIVSLRWLHIGMMPRIRHRLRRLLKLRQPGVGGGSLLLEVGHVLFGCSQ